MKSVIIKDARGRLLIRVTHHKNGKYSSVTSSDIANAVNIVVRGDDNKIIYFVPDKKIDK